MDWARLGTGIATGGLSEGYKIIKDATTNNFKAPVTATPEQIAAAQAQAQAAMQQQQEFVNALQAQGGIANQSGVFNQLQGVANGTGPNPAAAALQQATSANVANQASLAAGQRGAASNVGLMSRQAANQGANIQQNAAGQAATLQAQQSLGALNQMGGIANQQVAQQQQGVGNLNQFAQNNQAALMNQGNFQTGLDSGINAGNVATQTALIGGALNAAGGAATAAIAKKPQAAAEGGEILGPSSYVGKHLKMAHGGKVPVMVSPGETYVPPSKVGSKDPISAGRKIPGKPKHPGNDYRNDTVPRKLEKGGVVIPNSVMQSADPHKAAADFVAAVLAKSPRKPSK